jgi:isoleucyl-tRNA synthetase
LLGALDGFNKSEAVDLVKDYDALPELEKLALHDLSVLNQKIQEAINGYDFGNVATMLHDYCNQNLSAFYFDIRKDRLYCDRPDMFERRATRTVLAKILECLTVWFAPILSFTTEEVWSHRPKDIFENVDSVHMAQFVTIPQIWMNEALAQKWIKIADIRNAVLAALEPKRAEKIIGSSLEAHPIVTIPSDYQSAIQNVDLADVCITSQISIKNGDALNVEFQKAEGNKCERCWKILPEVGTDKDFPTLTLRDADAVRWYAKQAKAA